MSSGNSNCPKIQFYKFSLWLHFIKKPNMGINFQRLIIFILIISIFTLNILILSTNLSTLTEPVPLPELNFVQNSEIDSTPQDKEIKSSNSTPAAPSPNLDAISYPRPAIKQWAYLSTSTYNPLSYGLSNPEARSYFTYPARKPCPDPGILSLSGGQVKAACDKGGVKVFDSSRALPEKMGKSGMTFDLTYKANDSTLKQDSEFYLVQCESGKTDALLLNRKNESLIREINQSSNLLREKYSTKEFRPLTVLFFALDSASRNLIFRNLPKTVNLFNEINQNNDSNYLIYDFKLNNAVKAFTVPNMVSLHYGISIDTHEANFKDLNIDKSEDLYLREQADKSLWSHFKKLGFVTSMTSDGVGEILSTIFGRRALVDHQVSNFWRMSSQYFGLDEFKDPDVCIGKWPPHLHTLSYISQLMDNYKRLNKFIFAHVNTAHETTGTRLSIADDDFVDFFKSLCKRFSHESEDLVVWFGGDHGTSKGDFITNEGLAERALTGQFLLVNKQLVSRLQSDFNLTANTRRLVSRYDWHKTFKFLAYAPYADLQANSAEYKSIRTEHESISLFHEAVPEDRTCQQAGIYGPWCLSKEFKTLEPKDWPKDLVSYFAGAALSKINSFISSKTQCKAVALGKVSQVQRLSFEESSPQVQSNYLVHLSLSGSNSSHILLSCSQGNRNKYQNLRLDHAYQASRKSSYLKDKKNVVTIDMLWKVIRLGPLMTASELLATSQCENIIKYSHGLYLGAEGQTCSQVCQELGLQCRRPNYYRPVLDYVASLHQGIDYVGDEDSIEVLVDRVQVGREEFCQNAARGRPVCYCSMTGKDPWDRVQVNSQGFTLNNY